LLHKSIRGLDVGGEGDEKKCPDKYATHEKAAMDDRKGINN
jgi:hypothetical protein